ncbi:MAG: hypothetical protein ABIQ74_10350, partial [Chitinophagales bacterium]
MAKKKLSTETREPQVKYKASINGKDAVAKKHGKQKNSDSQVITKSRVSNGVQVNIAPSRTTNGTMS